MGKIIRKSGLGVLAVTASVLGLCLITAGEGHAAARQPLREKPAMRRAVSAAESYRPYKIVPIDFSTIDLQETEAIGVEPETVAPLAMFVLARAVLEYSASHADKNFWPYLVNVHVFAEQDVRDAVLRFYSRSPYPLWSDKGRITPRGQAVLAALAEVGADGLNPAEYLPPLPDDSFEGAARLQALADFDVTLSARLLRYVRDAGAGRLVANRLTGYHDLPKRQIDLDAVLANIAAADKPADLLTAYQPQSQWYAALKAELATLDAQTGKAEPLLMLAKPLRPGDSYTQWPQMIALLKNRASAAYLEKFGDILNRHENDISYDAKLRPAIQAWQKSMGKTADGIIGPATLDALQGVNTVNKRERVLYAMERLRWLPHDFSPRYVFINIPAFQAQYFEGGFEKLSMKAVVGSVHNQTNFFYDTISQVVFNPSWGVPQSIIQREMAPRIQADPSYLARRGYDVYDSRGRRIAAGSVDWNAVALKKRGVSIRQRPGAGNALGELKILFPNKHNIYLHDTPAKSAFKRDMRAISHGCVRLADPRAMAAAVMGMDEKALNRYFGKTERAINVSEPLPVYLSYFTAWPDVSTGQIVYYDDIYGWDAVMQRADVITRTSRLPQAGEQQATVTGHERSL